MRRNIKATTRGGALVEYGIVVAAIALISLIVILTFGSTIRTTFNNVTLSLAETFGLLEQEETQPLEPLKIPLDYTAARETYSNCNTIDYPIESPINRIVNENGSDSCLDISGGNGTMYAKFNEQMYMEWLNKRTNGSTHIDASIASSAVIVLDLSSAGYSEITGSRGTDTLRILGRNSTEIEIREHAEKEDHYVLTAGAPYSGIGTPIYPSLEFTFDDNTGIEEFHFQDFVLSQEQILELLP